VERSRLSPRRIRSVGIAIASAAALLVTALPASATPSVSLVPGTLALTGSISVHNSYDGRADCHDGVLSQDDVTLHVDLKPSRIVMSSMMGAATGIAHGATARVTIERNQFTATTCDDPAPTAPTCEGGQGKGLVTLTQTPPADVTTPVPLENPRLNLIVQAADAKALLGGNECGRYWLGIAGAPGGVAGLSFSSLWGFSLPAGLQMQGRNGLERMRKGAKKRWVINVTGPCEAFTGTASPRSRWVEDPPPPEPIRSCEMSGRFYLTFTRK
jgi:hypothetical protein